MYCQRVIEEFNNPFHMVILEKYNYLIENINAGCGDESQIHILYIEGKIENISFQSFGCASCLAITSFLCKSLFEKTIAEIKSLSRSFLEEAFNELEPSQTHCLDMAEVLLNKIVSTLEEGVEVQLT